MPHTSETPLRRIIRAFSSLDILILALAYAYFMVTDQAPLWFIGVIVAFFLMRWWATGKFTILAPISLPTAILLLLVPVTLWASVDWSLSLPKVYGLVLSIAICFSLLNHLHNRRDIWFMAFGLVLLAVGFVVLGLVGVNWGAGKVIPLPQLYDRFPQLITQIPRAFSGGGISPNGVGGVLVFFVPVLLSLIRQPPRLETDRLQGSASHVHFSSRLLQILLIGILLLVVGALLLTQSRGAVLGLFAGVLAWLIWRDKRWLIVVGLMLVAIVVIIASGRLGSITELLLQMDNVAGNVSRSAEGRFELWQRGMYMVQDFSFTGIGIGTFDRVVHLLYPLFLAGPDSKPTHVHNQLLQVAVDMGLPALVAYMALLGSFAFAAWRAYQSILDAPIRAFIVGLACGMLAHQVFGLTDAFLLGTKPAVVMWVYFGIIMGLFMQRHSIGLEVAPSSETVPSSPVPPLRSRLTGLLWAFLYWLLLSLLAISFIGERFYLGLAIALAGGLLVGYLCVKAFSTPVEPVMEEQHA